LPSAEYKSKLPGSRDRESNGKASDPGVHHITLSAPIARPRSISGKAARHALHLRAAQPGQRTESHIYFDPGDGRLITIFTKEDRRPVQRRTPTEPGCVHHIAFNVSRAVFMQAVKRLDSRGSSTPACATGTFSMRSISRPDGAADRALLLQIRAAVSCTHADVLFEAHHLRVARGDGRSAKCIWPMRSKRWSRVRKRACQKIEDRRTLTRNDAERVRRLDA